MWWNIRFVSLLNVFKSSSVLQIMHWKGLNLTFLNFLNIFFWDSYCFKVCCFYFWRELGCVNWIKTSIPILPWADVEICQFCHSKPAQPARRNSLSCHSNVNICKFSSFLKEFHQFFFFPAWQLEFIWPRYEYVYFSLNISDSLNLCYITLAKKGCNFTNPIIFLKSVYI